MIRFTLRQLRSSGILVAGALSALAVVLCITGPHLVHLYDTVVANCGRENDCSGATASFLNNDRNLQLGLDAVVVIVPCLLGLFWGAPLVARELESGTYRLAWTQGVTRLRWLALKLGIVGVASVATAGLLSLMATWWSSPIDRATALTGTIFTSFDQRDVVPLGYAAFAFMLGVLAGVMIRRTLPAMVTTLVVFVATRIALQQWVRPRLITPDSLTSAIGQGSIGFGSVNGGPLLLQPGGPNIPNAWVYSTQFVDKAGQSISPSAVTSLCPSLNVGHTMKMLPGPNGPSGGPAPGQVQSALQSCLAKLRSTYHLVTTYQPGSHYWPMQWAELGLYLALAIALAAFCYWWIRRRIA